MACSFCFQCSAGLVGGLTGQPVHKCIGGKKSVACAIVTMTDINVFSCSELFNTCVGSSCIFSSRIVQITFLVSTMCSHVQSYSTHAMVKVTCFFTDCSNFMFSPHIVQIVFFLHTLFTLFCTLFSGVGRRGVLHFELCSNKTPITMINNEHNKPAHER